MSGDPNDRDRAEERARRRAARKLIGAYHDEQLRALLERVREGFVRLDAGEIDAFELDELIHRYKRSARELWKFCGSSGSEWERAASVLTYWREQGEEPDWWKQARPGTGGAEASASGGRSPVYPASLAATARSANERHRHEREKR